MIIYTASNSINDTQSADDKQNGLRDYARDGKTPVQSCKCLQVTALIAVLGGGRGRGRWVGGLHRLWCLRWCVCYRGGGDRGHWHGAQRTVRDNVTKVFNRSVALSPKSPKSASEPNRLLPWRRRLGPVSAPLAGRDLLFLVRHSSSKQQARLVLSKTDDRRGRSKQGAASSSPGPPAPFGRDTRLLGLSSTAYPLRPR